jgi:hypothetical protein
VNQWNSPGTTTSPPTKTPVQSSSMFSFLYISGVPRNFFRGGGGSKNSVEDRGQRERGYGGGSPLVRGSTQLANE